MAFAEHYMVQGTITVPASSANFAAVNVNCGFLPSKVQIINESQWGQTGTGNENIQEIKWDSTSSSKTNITFINAAGTALVPSQLTSNGISLYNGQNAAPGVNAFTLGPKIAGTNTAKATATFTITSTATLYPGALILMTSNSVNKQLGGMMFTVNTIASGTTFTIANASWLNTANFTNGAETFNVQLVTVPPYYYPQSLVITNISAANPAVVTTSVNSNFTVGQQVRIRVPSTFGMTQINNLTAIVSAVSGNQITLGGTTGAFSLNNGLDSSAFTAFAWPAATSVPFNYATVTPIGSGPTLETAGFYNTDNISDATLNQSFQGFTVGTSIIQASAAGTVGVTTSDVLAWTAWRADV